VPLTLASLVESAKGGTIALNSTLERFDHDKKADAFELRFRDGSTRRARALILAMPRRALELINSPLLSDPAVTELIKSVTPRPLFKLFTTYASPWWLAAGVQKGRTVTDLPVRQTYYWPQNNGKPALSGRAMLMASYDDGSNISFWDGLRPKRGRGWRKEAAHAGELELFRGEADRENGDPEWLKYHAPLRMVGEVERQLQQIHGLGFVPSVVDAAFQDWGDDPFGGGWNNWNIGVKSWEVKERIVQPYADKDLHICGEAYSDAQGWVEGALQTADLMLARFGLKPLASALAKGARKKKG
jgi:monoamine oxidase